MKTSKLIMVSLWCAGFICGKTLFFTDTGDMKTAIFGAFGIAVGAALYHLTYGEHKKSESKIATPS